MSVLSAGDDVENRELEKDSEVDDANSDLEGLFTTLELPIRVLPLLFAQV